MCAMQSKAQTKDSVEISYLIIKSDGAGEKKIKEGRRILIKDTSFKRLRGKLSIINDSTLGVHNLLTGRRDTFLLGSIEKVRTPTLVRTVVSSYLVIAGPLLVAVGVALCIAGEIFGVPVLGLGILTTVGGAKGINGRVYPSWLYSYQVLKVKKQVKKN
jgi:hypothetical protein